MATERIVTPIIHQRLDTIEDQIVVDAIASNMARYHDENGPVYDHEMGSSAHHAIHCIAEACASVYEAGMDHETVWQAAQEHCVDAAIGLGWDFMRQVGEEGSGDERTREAIFRNVSAALYMFALDFQMENLAPNDDEDDLTTPSDLLLEPDIPRIVKDIVASEVRYMYEHGIVADDEAHQAIAVADIVANRPKALRHYAWSKNMEKAYDEITDEDGTHAAYQQRVAINRTQQALDAIAYEDDPEALHEPCERTLEFVETYFGDSEDMAAAVLHSIPESYLSGLYGQDSDAARQFEGILARAIESDYEIEGHTLWKLHKYLPGGLTGEVARHHPLIRQLRAQYRDDVSFLSAALPEMPPLNHPEATELFNQQMREMMTDVCVSLFPDAEFARRYAQDMARSFEPRLLSKKDAIGYAAYENSDDYKTMQVIINRLVRTVNKYGPERFMKIADTFDLGAIDVFSPRDIEILDILERGDKDKIEIMQQQDVMLVMFDAYGDHNGAMKNIAEQLNVRDARHERILIPWRHLEDFHETLAMLRRYGIKPSTIVIANHGDPGVMSFNKGAESFQIVSDMSVARTELGVHHPYDMSYSQMATIARHFMSLPRHGRSQRTPRKRFVLASCASDSAPENGATSIAEKGVRLVNQSDVSVIATEDYTTISGGENARGLHMLGNRAGQTSKRPRSSNMVELSIDPTASWTTITRRPIEERITP